MLLLSVIEKIVLELPSSTIFRITQVDTSLRNMCLQERFWKSKFSNKGLLLPEGRRDDVISFVLLYKRCKKIYPEVQKRVITEYNPHCCNLEDVPILSFPLRMREKVLPLLQAAQKAREEEEERTSERASQRIYSLCHDTSEVYTWYSVFIMFDHSLSINKNGEDSRMCLSEKLSKEEIDIFFLQLFLANGPS